MDLEQNICRIWSHVRGLSIPMEVGPSKGVDVVFGVSSFFYGIGCSLSGVVVSDLIFLFL